MAGLCCIGFVKFWRPAGQLIPPIRRTMGQPASRRHKRTEAPLGCHNPIPMPVGRVPFVGLFFVATTR